jgi:hypothetical protein
MCGFTSLQTLKVYLLNIFYGKEAGYSLRGDQENENDKPIGQYNMNNEGSGDMYYKVLYVAYLA